VASWPGSSVEPSFEFSTCSRRSRSLCLHLLLLIWFFATEIQLIGFFICHLLTIRTGHEQYKKNTSGITAHAETMTIIGADRFISIVIKNVFLGIKLLAVSFASWLVNFSYYAKSIFSRIQLGQQRDTASTYTPFS
jgi:hypothetical protein